MAKNIVAALGTTKMAALMQNHGAVAQGVNFEEAFLASDFLEKSAQVALLGGTRMHAGWQFFLFHPGRLPEGTRARLRLPVRVGAGGIKSDGSGVRRSEVLLFTIPCKTTSGASQRRRRREHETKEAAVWTGYRGGRANGLRGDAPGIQW